MSNSRDPLELHRRIQALPADQIDLIERLVSTLEAAGRRATNAQRVRTSILQGTSAHRDWPHAPLHRISEHGTYMVTASTLHKAPEFQTANDLDYLESEILRRCREGGWQLEAWAVFPNHYHFVGSSTKDSQNLRELLTQLHAETAIEVNRRQDQSGRQVWFNFWDTQLSFESSYLARLHYVHQNAVKHRIVPVGNQYRWCSAALV